MIMPRQGHNYAVIDWPNISKRCFRLPSRPVMHLAAHASFSLIFSTDLLPLTGHDHDHAWRLRHGGVSFPAETRSIASLDTKFP